MQTSGYFLNLGTTLLVFGWAALLSLMWAVAVYVYLRGKAFWSHGPDLSLLPALVISPLFIMVGFGLFKVNIIFPAHSAMTILDFILYCLLPAIVLFIASGLGYEIFSLVRTEYRDIQSRQFYLFARAMGLSVDRISGRFIISKGLIDAWVKCLPWFFGELVVVEAMFNAPGLGYHSWMYAKMRNFHSMTISILWLVGIYIILALIAGYYSRWMGQKLESYN